MKAEIVNQLNDWRWRINNLYRIVDKDGDEIVFKMNWAQETLFNEMHYLNVILKARQLGFTTFIQVFMLDACFFNKNVNAGTIAHKLDAAKEIFKTKIKYPYEHMDPGLIAANPATSDTERSLEFQNGSKISVDTSFRSGTYQYLHISEFGKICATDPDRAEEIVTGAFNTVQAGNLIFVESTAEGQAGRFFELCERSQHYQGDLTKMDWKFFFFPWWQEPGYRLDADVSIPQHLMEYFKDLELQKIELDDQQRAWYAKKEADQQDKMKREYPSTPKEAFEQAIEGAYFSRPLNTCRKRDQITKVPHYPAYPVDTYWDLGKGDSTSIWFHQKIGMKHCFIDYYENSGEDPPHYMKILEERGKHNGGELYTYGKHYMPHDADNDRLGGTIADQFRELGMKNIRISDRVKSKQTPIEATRTVIPVCWFDEENCNVRIGRNVCGIGSLAGYHKRWNEKLATYSNEPLHNWASHGADAFMEFAMNQQVAERQDSSPISYNSGKQYA